MSTAVLIRPGCTDFDDQHRIQGSLSLPLNERGEAQLALTVERVTSLPLQVVFSAPCEPALSTARAIAQRLDIPVRTLDDLGNLDQGLWQGLKVEEIRHKYPKVFKRWKDSPECICPPEGETIEDAAERVIKALTKPLKRKKCIAIVSSEPLATLIGCMLRREKLELAEPGEFVDDEKFVQVFEVDGPIEPPNNVNSAPVPATRS